MCSTGRLTVKCLEIRELWYVAYMLAYASVLHITICRISVVAFDPCDHLGNRVMPMFAVYATTTVVVTVAAGTRGAWYGLTGPLNAEQSPPGPGSLLDTILAVINHYSTVPVLLLDCTGPHNPRDGLKWECDPPPFRGWSWVPAAMLGCYRAPPKVCSKEGGEAVPRTYGPWPMARAEAVDTGCQRDIREIWNPIPNH